jgi:hypothetical protein
MAVNEAYLELIPLGVIQRHDDGQELKMITVRE